MSNRLKEIRLEKKLTQKEVSLKTGIPVNTYSNYERGDREPKLATWQKLADYFDVSVGYLQGVSKYASRERPPILDNTEKPFDDDDREHIKKALAYHDEQVSDYLSERFRNLIGDDEFTSMLDDNLSNLSDRLLVYRLLNGVSDGVMSILVSDIGLKKHRIDLKKVAEQLDEIDNYLRKLSDKD